MKNILFLLTVSFTCIVSFSQEQKTISDCTIIYSVVNADNSEQKQIGSKVIFIKGKNIRVDLTSKAFTQTVIYNNRDSNSTVLKNIGDSKYIAEYNAAEWQKANEVYDGVAVSFTDDTKNILSYNCRQAVLKLKNGNTYVVYYTPDLMPSIMESPFELKNIPGLVLQYEASINHKEKIIYTAEKIDFKPVPALEFDIPKSGYRILH